jgi:hypothetical protein
VSEAWGNRRAWYRANAAVKVALGLDEVILKNLLETDTEVVPLLNCFGIGQTWKVTGGVNICTGQVIRIAPQAASGNQHKSRVHMSGWVGICIIDLSTGGKFDLGGGGLRPSRM